MKKVLKLSKEQARTLYSLLSNAEIVDRSDNRKRFKFLEVFEDFVFEYDDQIEAFKGKPVKEIKDKLVKLGEETKEFTFDDREVFAKIKDIFEKCYKTGFKSRDTMGKTISSPLIGRDAKIYMELEDAFMDVREIEDKKK